MKESALEANVAAWCKAKGYICWKLQPPPKGIPDRIVIVPGGRPIFLELKAMGGRLSDHQINMISKLQAFGYQVGIPRTRDEAITLIEESIFI